MLFVRGLLWSDPLPHSTDPSHRLTESERPSVELVGRLLRDPHPLDGGGCSALVDLERLDGRRSRGRTQLLFRSCPSPLPQQAWRVAVEGSLRRPSPGVHPRLPGAAERLARQGCWTQLRVRSIRVLHQPRTPLADARRRIAQRLTETAGSEPGSLLAALVLGGAQVTIPQGLRESFRVAGLSHALAASGFHLSVLLGATLAIGRCAGRAARLVMAALTLVGFVLMAGAQPSVVRAALMAGIALLIRDRDHRSHGLGLLIATLVVMLLVQPTWARAIGFQFSAAATAGLLITAPGWSERIGSLLPSWLNWLAPALAVPLAAMAWTLPLQLLHFGSAPVYALLANVLAAPLLTPLTLGAMVLAGAALLVPDPAFGALCWPLQLLAQLLIALVHWISSWPGAQLLTGHPPLAVVLMVSLGLLPWLWPSGRRRWTGWALPVLLIGFTLQLTQQLRSGVVAAHRHGRHWVLARHQGRAVMVSRGSDAQSCRMARRLATFHGHDRLDWVVLLDQSLGDARSCWQSLAHHVHHDSGGLSPGQRVVSDGLELSALARRGGSLRLEVGSRQWWLFPRPQALWDFEPSAARQSSPEGIWLGFQPSKSQLQRLRRSGNASPWVATSTPGLFSTREAAL